MFLSLRSFFLKSKSTISFGIIIESRDHELFCLFPKSISKHVIYICWSKKIWCAIYALINILRCLLSDKTLVQNVDNSGSIAWLDLKHLADQVSELLAVHGVDWWVGSSEDLDSQTIDGLGIEGMSQVAHLVENTT